MGYGTDATDTRDSLNEVCPESNKSTHWRIGGLSLFRLAVRYCEMVLVVPESLCQEIGFV